jgi:hypothetical protein
VIPFQVGSSKELEDRTTQHQGEIMLFFDEIVLCHREPGVLVRRTLTQALVVSTEVTRVNKLMTRIVVPQAIYTSISLCA